MPSFFKRIFGLSLVYVVGDILTRGLSIVLLPLYTRYLTPDNYGLLGLASMLGQLLVMLLSFSAYSVVQRFYYQFTDEAERRAFLGSFWLLLLTVPGGVLAGLFLFGEPLFQFLLPGLPFQPYIRIMLATAYLNIAFETMLMTLFRAREQAGRYVAFSVASLLVTTSVTIYLVVFRGQGALGVLQAQLAAAIVLAVGTIWVLRRQVSLQWRNSSLREALIYGLPLVPHFFAHWVLSLSDRAILERYVSLGQLGLYSLAYQFGAGYQMLVTSANNALIPMFSRAARSDSEFNELSRVATYYLLVVGALGLAIALLAPDVIALITPPDYHEAGGLVPWVALGIAALGVYYLPMNVLSMTAGKTRLVPVMTVLAGAVNVILNLALIPLWGALAAAVATAVGYAVLAVLVMWVAQATRPIDYERARIIKIAAACFIVYGLGRFVMHFAPGPNLLMGLAMVACLPLVLAAFGFWTKAERQMGGQAWQRVARLWASPTARA